MNKLNKAIYTLMAGFCLCTLTSCSSYELLYEYYDDIDGYIVYSQESTVSRYNLMDSIQIAGLYAYKPVLGISSYTFYKCSNLRNVALPSNIKQIGAYSFSECHSLASIYFPKSLEVIDSCAFKGCALNKVNIPANVNHIGTGAFADCPLEEITIDYNNSSFDTTKDIHAIIHLEDKKLIQGCKNTVIPDYVKTIGAYSFYGTTLEHIDIPASVEEILNYAFYNCDSLSEINIPSTVKCIEDRAFSSNTKVNYSGTISEFLGIYQCTESGAKGLTITCSDGSYTYS